MSAHTDKHREEARYLAAIQCGSDDQCHPGVCKCRDDIAAALAASEREGMRRAAEIARGFANSQHIAHDIRVGIFPEKSDIRDAISDAILSEITPSSATSPSQVRTSPAPVHEADR